MDVFLQMAESLLASPWLFLLVFVLVVADAVFPVIPAETVVITAGAYAITGSPDAVPLVLAAAAGALTGDVLAHHIGRSAGRLTRFIRRRRAGEAIFSWARKGLRARGGPLILLARFIPGGRTATNIAAGMVGLPRSTFLLYSTLAGSLWALYSTGIGMVGGLAFRDQPLIGVVVGVGLSTVVGLIIELVRRRRAKGPSDPAEPAGGVAECVQP